MTLVPYTGRFDKDDDSWLPIMAETSALLDN